MDVAEEGYVQTTCLRQVYNMKGAGLLRGRLRGPWGLFRPDGLQRAASGGAPGLELLVR